MKLTRRQAVLSGAAALMLPWSHDAEAHSHGSSITTVTWDRLVTNGGGLSPGISIADDGTVVCYADTNGPWKFDKVAGLWKEIGNFLQNSNPLLFQFNGYRGLNGGSDCQIAPGNSNFIYYFLTDGWSSPTKTYLCLSKDGGLTSDITGYPPNTQAGNGGQIIGSNDDVFKRVQCKIGIDPNNENVVYVTNPGGQPLVSFNAGKTFSSVPNLPVGNTVTIGAGCWQFDRSSGTTTVNGVTVTDTIYVAVEGSGVWQSTNGGVSFSQISSSVGFLRPGYCSITSDGVYFLADIQANSASGTGGTGGVSSTTINITSIASGKFNPGNPITGSGISGGTLVVSGPPGGGPGNYTLSQAATVTNGTTVTVASSSGYSTVNRWQSGAWSIIWQNGAVGSGTTARTGINVAAHPTVNGTIAMMVSGGTPHFLASSDYGTTLTRTNKTSESFTPSIDSPWYSTQQAQSGFTTGNQQMVFDRSNPSQLYVNWGQGIMTANLTVGTPPTWAAFCKGLEQTVCNMTVAESGVPILQAVDDLLGFVHQNPSGLQTPPANPISGPFLLLAGWAAAIDPYNTQNQIIWGVNALSGVFAAYYTTDAWATVIVPFPSQPAKVLWNVTAPPGLVFSNGIIIFAPAGSGDASNPPYLQRITFSDLIAGNPWTPLGPGQFSNGADFPATGSQGWCTGAVPPNHQIAADRVTGNLFYAYNVRFQSPVIKGMYVSTDGGVTWTYQTSSTDPAPSNGFGFIDIKPVPGMSGLVYATCGYHSTNPPPDTSSKGSLWVLTWSGTSMSIAQITNMKEANYIGWGKAGPTGLPTLYAAGFLNPPLKYGIFMSETLGQSWKQLVSDAYGPWPISNNAVYGVEGDKDVFGRCYVSFAGSGTAYSTLAA